jgi:hypothetical protein
MEWATTSGRQYGGSHLATQMALLSYRIGVNGNAKEG